jgi:hypothetical protein
MASNELVGRLIGQVFCHFRDNLSAAKALRSDCLIRYKGRGPGLKAVFTLLRDLGPMRTCMPIRSAIRAINQEAPPASCGAALILGGLLLLSAP